MGDLLINYKTTLWLCLVNFTHVSLEYLKHRNGDLVYPFPSYIRRNILLCVPVETKPVILLGNINTYYWTDTIKNKRHLLLDLEVPEDVEEFYDMEFTWYYQVG